MFDCIFDSDFWVHATANFIMLMTVAITVRRSERKRAIVISKRIIEKTFRDLR